MLPIVFVVSLMYWSFLWRMGPIPSESYPYAQLMWPLQAFDRALFFSSTMYSRMWRGGEEVEGALVSPGEAVWSPSNLQDEQWWYWRVKATLDVEIPDPNKRQYGAWSDVGHFYTNFGDGKVPEEVPGAMLVALDIARQSAAKRDSLRGPPVEDVTTVQRVWPEPGIVVVTANPNFRAIAGTAADSVDFFFEVDRLITFDGEFLQRSADRPLLFETLWRDLTYTGDGRDDDGDGRIDEELVNNRDDDGDGAVDEDIRHPLKGWKWPIILIGGGFGLFVYFSMSFLGMPVFLIWGYVQSVLGIPHNLLPQILGALLARFYFWKRYGKQEWRRYAMVLAVGFGVGMSLIGMFCAALAMVSKAVSALQY